MTKKERVFKAIADAGEAGVLNTILNEIQFRYGASIYRLNQELIPEGEQIICKPVGNTGLYRYWLINIEEK